MHKTDDILTRLTMLYPKAIEPGLERTLRILKDLDNPHLKLPPVVHVAGTNGKGSTLAFIRAVAEQAGLACHVMTSPHLVKFNERLVVASREISDEALLELLRDVETKNDGKPITFFEITTGAGFLAFAQNRADLCLLETGMGGRLDSTNVIENPVVTIITNISSDHMQHLGDTLPKIAFEKAGIMKRGVPCVIGEQTQEALDTGVMAVFERRAAEMNAPLFRHGHEWSYTRTENGFTLHFQGNDFDLPQPGLLGAHQIANAAAAIMAILATPQLSFLRNFEDISHARWPARLQKIASGKLFDLLPEGWELFLDGGHNEAGGAVLANQVRQWREQDNKPLHLLLGMLTTKDPEPFFNHLKPFITSATAIPIPDEKLAFTADELSRRLSIPQAAGPEEALKMLVATHPGKARVLITGSLYLAGTILKTY